MINQIDGHPVTGPMDKEVAPPHRMLFGLEFLVVTGICVVSMDRPLAPVLSDELVGQIYQQFAFYCPITSTRNQFGVQFWAESMYRREVQQAE